MFFSSLNKDFSNTSVNFSTVKSPHQELQSVITQIERENKYVIFIKNVS